MPACNCWPIVSCYIYNPPCFQLENRSIAWCKTTYQFPTTQQTITWLYYYTVTMLRTSLYLLVIWFQTLHNTRNAKFVVTFRTVQCPTISWYQWRVTATPSSLHTTLTLLLDLLYTNDRSFCLDLRRQYSPTKVDVFECVCTCTIVLIKQQITLTDTLYCLL